MIRKITPFTDTVRAVHATFREAFTPALDRNFSPLQEMDRVAPRRALGQKLTPLGRGRNRRRRDG